MEPKQPKTDGYLFRSELQLNKSSIDELLKQVREQERERAQFSDFFALDMDPDTLQ